MKWVMVPGLLILMVQCAKPLVTKDLRLSKRVSIDLPETSSFGPPVAATYRMEVQNRGKTYRFPAQVEIEADRLVIVGLTPVGSRAFALTYEATSLSYDVIPFFNLPLRPDRLMLAYCLMVWPPDAMRPVLVRAGLTREDHGATVDFLHDGKPVLRLFRKTAESGRQVAILQHLREGYWVKLETLQWQVFED